MSPRRVAEIAGATPPAALACLYEAHHATLLRICRGYLRDPAEAEDAVQDTFLAAYRSMLRGSVPDQPLAWLIAIARNICRKRLQRLAREPLSIEVSAEPVDDGTDAASAAVRGEERGELWRAVRELPLRQQNAFMLCAVAGETYADAAARLELSKPALEALLVRARRRLRQQLRSLPGGLQACVPVPFEWLARTGATGGTVAPTAANVVKTGAAATFAKIAATTAGVLVLGGATVVARDALPRVHRHRLESSAWPTMTVVPRAIRHATPDRAPAAAVRVRVSHLSVARARTSVVAGGAAAARTPKPSGAEALAVTGGSAPTERAQGADQGGGSPAAGQQASNAMVAENGDSAAVADGHASEDANTQDAGVAVTTEPGGQDGGGATSSDSASGGQPAAEDGSQPAADRAPTAAQSLPSQDEGASNAQGNTNASSE